MAAAPLGSFFSFPFFTAVLLGFPSDGTEPGFLKEKTSIIYATTKSLNKHINKTNPPPQPPPEKYIPAVQ